MSDTQVWRPFRLSESTAHAALQRLAAEKKDLDVRAEFDADDHRLSTFTHELEGLYVDMSKQRWDKEVLDGLQALAVEADLKGAVADMFSGVKLNTTKTAQCCGPSGRSRRRLSGGWKGCHGGRAGRSRAHAGFRGRSARLHKSGQITDVVNIGIGGSDLGPAMAVKALRRFANGPACHFVSNVDGAHVESVLSGLNPKTTMLVIVSKTFTTQETMANARIAKDWLVQGGGKASKQLVAVSTNLEGTRAFGIDDAQTFGFENWVGGRYSMWGPVGICIALSIGSEGFRSFLSGARAMDVHTKMPASKRIFRCCWPCSAIGIKMYSACVLMW